MKPYLFSGHMVSYVETFQGVSKVKSQYQNDEVSKGASQTQTSISLYIVAINTQKQKLKIQRGWLIG